MPCRHLCRRKQSGSLHPQEGCFFRFELGSSCNLSQPSLTADSDSGVILCCLDCFLGNGALYRFEYGVLPSVFLAKLRGGTCTTAESDPPDTVIDRAMHLLHTESSTTASTSLSTATPVCCRRKSRGWGGAGRRRRSLVFLWLLYSRRRSSSWRRCLWAWSPSLPGRIVAGRYITDIGVRKDVVKVAVEDLAATMGCRSSNERLVGKVSGGSGNVPSIIH
ncbi:hypothetical protein B296_00057110 [Ensete ventricosum]|uniref:Uncharacterized protein n=1 Tax=Ensete ventricosum TaxID=4639 RepID=A0A426WXX2_ENSVE|nr:hypothetical protein B296_00057110 [Ensete ventricosum]